MRFKHLSDEELQSFFLAEPGIYDFEVIDAKDRVSKSGNEMIELKIKIWDKDGNQRVIFDYLLEAMKFKLKHFADCCGLTNKYKADEIGSLDCVGKSGKVDIIIQQGQPNPAGGYYPDKNSVKDYVQPDENVVQAKKVSNGEDFFNDDVPF